MELLSVVYIENNILGSLLKLDELKDEEYEMLYNDVISVGEYPN